MTAAVRRLTYPGMSWRAMAASPMA